MIERIKSFGKDGHSFSKNFDLGEYLKSKNNEGLLVLVVFFSNGSFDGEIERFASFAKQSPVL